MRIAITSCKGGSGKTTLAVHLAAYSAGQGKRVLLVDADAQGSATRWLDVQPRAGLADVLLDRAPVAGCIVPVQGVDLLPADRRLETVDIALASRMGRERLLSRSLEGSAYDLVVFDLPPSMSLLALNALLAATHVIVPVRPDWLDVDAAGRTVALLQEMAAGLDYAPRMAGVVVNQMRPVRAHREVVEQIAANHTVLQPYIPLTVDIAACPGRARTVWQHVPRHGISDTMTSLMRSITHECKKT